MGLIIRLSLISLLFSIDVLSNVVHLYIDADRSGAKESGVSIEQGIRTALSEVKSKLAGFDVKIVIRDHHGSTPRSKKHLLEYLSDPKALVLFSGMHSPPLLAHRDFINKNGILVLNPWAAAGPITRYPSNENWIFRLSIDDTKAGYVLVNYAIDIEQFKHPYLLLENTGWGKSNESTIRKALEQKGISAKGVEWFNWNLGLTGAKVKLRKIYNSGADVIVLVANATEGKTIALATSQLMKEQQLPVRSHWGITGGDFTKVINNDIRQCIDFMFLQTKFSFLNNSRSIFSYTVFEYAKRTFPDTIKDVYDIQAPTGFIHAYDLTRLLIAAVEDVGLTGNMISDRSNVRTALENITKPVQGLLKTYQKPFSVFSANDMDAHEALDATDLTMARFGRLGEILLVTQQELKERIGL